ncbi:MAG: CHASE domain-containing protein [Pseudomonadota bacterium]
MPFFVLLLGLVATVILFISTSRLEQSRIDMTFERQASIRVTAIKDGIDETINTLRFVNQSFNTFGPVSREQFHTLTQPLLARSPALQALSFHRYVSASERPAYEARMSVLFPGFYIKEVANGVLVPAGQRERYRVIEYIEPQDSNAIVLGFDVSTRKEQVDAVRRAEETSLPAATPLYENLIQTKAQRGFVVLMPVYKNNSAPDGQLLESRSVIGHTTAVFSGKKLLETILVSSELLDLPAFNISVYASDNADEERLVFRKGQAAPSVAAKSNIVWDTLMPMLGIRERFSAYSRSFNVAGTPWHMDVSSSPLSFADQHLLSLLILLVGCVLSVAAAAYLRFFASRTEDIQILVEQRTLELARINQRLTEEASALQLAKAELGASEERLQKIIDVMPIMVFIKDLESRIILMNEECQKQWGISFKEVRGTNRSSFIPPPQLEKILQDDQAVFASRQPVVFENSAWSASLNQDRQMYTIKRPVFDAAGKPSYLIAVAIDITERKAVEEALKQSQILLRDLAAHQETIKENERKRVSREIHDDLGQHLLVLRIDVTMLHTRTATSHPKLHRKVSHALEQIDATIKRVRAIINDLRPSVLDLGLSAAFDWQVEQFERRSGIACKLTMDEEDIRIDDDMATALFRIFQESLTNIHRHSQATQVKITLHRHGKQLCMKVSDNGIGTFIGNRRKSNSYGLLGIRERVAALGGELTIESDPGQGMNLMISIPIVEQVADQLM